MRIIMLLDIKCLAYNSEKELCRTSLLMAFMIYEQQFHRDKISSKYSLNCPAISAHE